MPRPREYASNADRQRAYRERARKKTRQALRNASGEWYTPPGVVDLVRQVLGRIDLDPASCAVAQKTIQAKSWFDKETDGLKQPWNGRVFLNPPYSYPLVEQFTRKLVDEYSAGRTRSAICLVNNATDAEWFHALLGHFVSCFTTGRIRFYRADRKATSPRLGQVFFYLGPDVRRFVDTFKATGTVMAPAEGKRW